MTTKTAPTVEETTTNDEELDHYYCSCDDTHALCGTSTIGMEIVEEFTGTLCIVCDDMADQPCPRCGE